MNASAIPFELRPLTSDDEQAALEVYRGSEDFLALCPVPTGSLEMVLGDMQLSVNAGSQFCGIVDANGTMMGIVDYLVSGFEGNAAHAFLELLMIAQPYRNSGLGSAVVAQVEAEIRRNPEVTAILAGVQVNNSAAVRFWQKMGYWIVSEARDIGDGTTAYDLHKDLR